MQERRKYPRVEAFLPLKITSADYDIVTETKNISASGAYCTVDEPLPLMTKLSIIILLPFKHNSGGERGKNIKKINCGGAVVRKETVRDNGKHLYRVGIFFNEISDKDRKVIVSYINSFRKKALQSA